MAPYRAQCVEGGFYCITYNYVLNDYQMVDIHAMGFPSNWQEEPLWR
jgi:hypothetical protein